MSEQALSSEPVDLRLFHELNPAEQDELWRSASQYLDDEAKVLAAETKFPHLEALDVAVTAGILVPVEASPDFGVVAPIRHRYDLNRVKDGDGSVPYLRPQALHTLRGLAAGIRQAAPGSAFAASLDRAGSGAFRPAVTSMTRTSHYQHQIGQSGKFARKGSFEGDSSGHETGFSFDLDHTAFYATGHDGAEIALNPSLTGADLESYKKLVPYYRSLVRGVVEQQLQDGAFMALEEVPKGWGVWHVTTVPDRA